MLKRLATLLLLLSGFTALPGATYYISPTGNDTTGNGSSGSPWKTYNKAATNLVAGDILLVQPGIYPVNGNTNYSYGTPYCRFLTAGTSNAPITLRANGPVTNQFGFLFPIPYYYIDGFTWDGDYSGGIYMKKGSGYITATNCTFQNGQVIGVSQDNPNSTQGGLPQTAPSYCTIINSRFLQLTNGGCVTLFGVNNLCQGNVFANGGSQDSIYILGSNNVIRLNTFTNMAAAAGMGNHPDILQTFGDNGFWMVNALFEQNYVVNCPIQLMMFETSSTHQPGVTVQTNNSCWGIVLRNNVFEDSNMQCSIDVPNVRFYNNTFRRCSNGGSLIAFGFWDPTWSAGRGVATGGAVVNNAFIDCSGPYVSVSVGPSQADLTNNAAVVKGRANIYANSGIYNVWGVYSNLVGTITSGTLYCPAGDLYTVNATNFSSGIFNVAIQHTDPANGISYIPLQAGYYNSGQMYFRINSSSFPGGEIATIMPLYVADTSSITNNSNYNYKGQVAEAHGLQSGNLGLVATNGYPPTLAAPTLGSVLIDAGRNLSSLGVTNDFLGTVRPQGGGFDIGAFEYSGSAPPPVPPTITLQPQSVITNAGATVTLSVGATGTAPISYQWLRNGTSIPGATASSLLKSNVQLADAGAYSVVVTNSGGSATSTTANLTVLTSTPVPPSITAQPQSVATSVGASVTFSVSASGSDPLSFQWRLNGISIAGATASTFTKSNTQINDAGNYSVVVSNSAGTAASANALLTLTFSGITGPDPSLVLHFDFDENFSSGRVPDASGKGNDGWQMNPTNWITSASGVFGSTAAQFTYVGTMTNNPPNVYPLSQYLAVTNVSGFEYLTNGTISLWARFDTNSDLMMMLLDNGYSAGYAGNPALALNSWSLCRDGASYLSFVTYPAGAYKSRVVSWPDDTVKPGGSTPILATTNFHLYTVTIDCVRNQAIAYYDGAPYTTNAINLPWLHVYGCAAMRWLCIGARSHDGSPQWGDDKYPNSSFFTGKMDDIRIYNRTLSAAEAQDLYTGTPVKVRPPPPAGLRIVTAGP